MQNYPFNHGLPGPASRPRQVDPTVRALGKPVKPALIITPPYELPSSRSDGPRVLWELQEGGAASEGGKSA